MQATNAKLKQGRGVIERYREYLPFSDSTPIISLGEGNTPLIHCPKLSKRVGRDCDVFVKNEGVNPTGSFKDRGMTVAVSKALERGASALVCASTGNTSASAAAYAARAGISCAVILPAGKIARGKLVQAFAYGAKIVAINGNFDDAFRIVRELGERDSFVIVRRFGIQWAALTLQQIVSALRRNSLAVEARCQDEREGVNVTQNRLVLTQVLGLWLNPFRHSLQLRNSQNEASVAAHRCDATARTATAHRTST